MLRENPVVKKVVAMGEEQMGKTVQHLFSNERFVSAVQAIVANSLKAKGVFDKNLKAALSAMNLPTAEDFEALQKKLGDLEKAIERVESKVGDGTRRRAAPKK